MTLEFTSLTRFTKIFIETRIKHAPMKKNILAQTTQILSQKAFGAMTLRSRLRNSLLEEKYLKSKKAYNKQRNISVKIFKKSIERALSKKLTYQKILTTRNFGKL